LADRIIVYWRDIPAQVIVKAGRRSTAKRELPERFVHAIDACAMRVGARDTDSYLAEWRRGPPSPAGTIWKLRRTPHWPAWRTIMAGIGFGSWSITAAGRTNKPPGPYQPSHISVTRRLRRTYTIRRWSVRHSRFLEMLYAKFAGVFLRLHPVWSFVGYRRAEGR
jgi:hypothetical protein